MKNKYIKSAIFLGAFGMTAVSALAQTGPGGVSATGTNTNLKLWLRADRQTYSNSGTTPSTNGTIVQQWNDMSGNGKVAFNSTTTTCPTWATGGANGLPTVNFNGTNQTTASGVDIRPAVMPNVTIIAVAKSNVLTGMGKIWGHDAPVSGNGFHRAVGMDTRATSSLGYFAGTGVGNYGSVSQNTYFISTVNYTSTAFTGFINGAQTATGAVTCNGGLTAISIGSITPSSEFWNGSISEFIIFDKILSQAERLMVENYLSAKYAIGMTTGTKLYTMDAPSNGDYDYEVAGLISGPSGTPVSNSQGSGIVTLSNPSNIGTNQSFMFGHDNGPLALTGVNRPHAGLTSRLARTWRPSEIGDMGTMNVSFDVTGITGVPANVQDYFMIIDRDNDGLFTDESSATGGVVAASSKVGNIVTFNGVNIADAQRFSMAFGNTVALPLELISFSAAPAGMQNKIEWQTANVKGVGAMELERSTNGSDFSLLNRVPVNASGNYAVNDEQPAAVTYYRLRILDQDGSSSFGNIVKVLRHDHSGTLRISPNPASDIAQISGLPGTEATIRLFDMSGRQLQVQRTATSTATISLGAYPAGSYLVSVDAEGMHAVEQVVKY